MGFSGIGWGEILLILVVALLVLGPNRIPEIARTLGKTVRAIRKASADLTTTVTRELEIDKKEPPPAGNDKPAASNTGTTKPEPDNPKEKPGEASTEK
jgi:sec-independent protein translocase protein TatA